MSRASARLTLMVKWWKRPARYVASPTPTTKGNLMTDRIDKDTPPALAAILNLDNARRRARISKRIASVAPKHPPCKVIELTEGMGQHKIHTRTRTLKVGKREHSPLGPFSEIGEIVGGVWVFRPNGWDHWIYFV